MSISSFSSSASSTTWLLCAISISSAVMCFFVPADADFGTTGITYRRRTQPGREVESGRTRGRTGGREGERGRRTTASSRFASHLCAHVSENDGPTSVRTVDTLRDSHTLLKNRYICHEGRPAAYRGDKNSTMGVQDCPIFVFFSRCGVGTVHTQYCKISTLSTTLPSEIGDFQIIFLRQHLEPSTGRVPINPVSKENSTKSWYQSVNLWLIPSSFWSQILLAS